METIQVNARLRIKSGQRQAFEDLARQIIQAVREREPETLQYLWYMNENGSECIVREIYASSEAALAHVRNTGDLVSRLVETAELELVLFGPASKELREVAARFNAPVYDAFDGVDRLTPG